jgi:hypothetical protein
LLGREKFDPLAREFGHEHAGGKVSASDFREFLEAKSGRNLRAFFDAWTGQKGLPQTRLGTVETRRNSKGWVTRALIQGEKGAGATYVPLTVESGDDYEEVTASVILEGAQVWAEIQTEGRPHRITANKHGNAGCENSQPFTILTFDTELEDSLIVYGTLTDATANLEAARTLQQALRRREHNIAVPFKPDTEVSDAELRTKHLILIGRPAANRVLTRFEKELPIHFGTQSFEVRENTYAHPQSAVVFAMQNPLNARFSLVAVAGLSGLGTLRVVPAFEDETLPYAQVVVLAHGHETESFTLPATGLVRELK